MPDTQDLPVFLKTLAAASGLSGYETPVRQIIETAWQPITDELHTSRMGSLHGLRRAALPASPNAAPPCILLAAHMDAIGLMVASIAGEFLHISSVGGVDPRVLPGQLVNVHGRELLPGLVVQPAPHLLPPAVRDKTTPLEYLLVDLGLPAQELQRLVRAGDLISFAQPPLEMGGENPGDYIAGHSLDNRVSVAALTACLAELQNTSLKWDVWAAATVQEETTLAGAATSAFQLHPSLAVAIDTTFAAGPGSSGYKTFPLDGTITIGWGADNHPILHQLFASLADRLEIPWKMEVLPNYSGTDAMATQIALEGIPSIAISIPIRYMHTPVELVSLKGITNAARLLAAFAAQLDEQFMDRLAWPETGE